MIWGAAVNLASRVESQGQSGTIQISRSTYDLIKDQFDCESRGTIKVKGEKQNGGATIKLSGPDGPLASSATIRSNPPRSAKRSANTSSQ